MTENEKLQKLTFAAVRLLAAHGLASNCQEQTRWAGTPQQQARLADLHQTLNLILPPLPGQQNQEQGGRS